MFVSLTPTLYLCVSHLTLLSSFSPLQVAYRARTSRDILAGVDEFLHQAVVLPPGSWDASTRIDPPSKLPTKEQRMAVVMAVAKRDEINNNHSNELKNGIAG